MKLVKKFWKAMLLCCCLLFLVGCGQEEALRTAEESFLLEINNFNFAGKEVKLGFNRVPQRVLATRPEILDVLRALGVEDRVVMASFPRNMAEQIPLYQQSFPQTKLTLNEIDQETAVMERPDFIIGWRRSFHRGALGSTEYWQKKGVPVYIEENSGPIPAVEPFPPATVAGEINFITNMGKIFQREAAAAREVKKIEQTLVEAQRLSQQHQPRTVLSIALMRDKIEVFGDGLLLGHIVNLLGSKNINYPYPFINGEQLLKTDPDVIFVVYHGGPEEEELALRYLLKEPYRKMRAVKNKKLYPINYKYICASNVRTSATIKLIYQGLYEGKAQ